MNQDHYSNITQVIGKAGTGKTYFLASKIRDNLGKTASMLIDIRWEATDILLEKIPDVEKQDIIVINIWENPSSFQHIFSLRDIFAQKKTVVYTFPMAYFGYQKTCVYIALILIHLFEVLHEVNDEVNIYIDEFQHFQTKEMLDLFDFVIQNTERFSLIFAHQYFEQILNETHEASSWLKKNIRSLLCESQLKRVVFPLAWNDQQWFWEYYPSVDFSQFPGNFSPILLN
jgi:hypothetical protein